MIEVVAAIALLELVAVSILGLFAMGGRWTSTVEDRLVASNLLQMKMEEVKCKDFTTDVSENGSSYSGYSKYSLNVSQVSPYLGNPNLKRINVDISWMDPLEINQNETVATLVANY